MRPSSRRDEPNCPTQADDVDAVRDEILRRADIAEHAQRTGFRRRGRACVPGAESVTAATTTAVMMMTGATNRSRPTRRSKADIDELRAVLHGIVERGQPMTCRQIFYQAVTRGVVEKTEGEYKQTIIRLLADMRRRGDLPYGWIADNTRWQRKPTTYSSLRDMLEQSIEFYRRALWDNQDTYVEVWLEKDALAGVVYEVTGEFDVPLMVTRGYSSLSFLHSAAEAIAAQGKPAYLYYFGDHDPSGMDITRAVETGLREMAPDADIHFERLAVTREQTEDWNLPTRPTKKTDTRSKNFASESVELDAIAPDDLRWLVRAAIEQHIDRDQLERLRTIEQQERETLRRVAVSFTSLGARE